MIYKCEKPEDLPAGESIPRIICRYLNSGMPVIVAAGDRHAFTLVGYRRVDPGTADERIHFIRQDDEAGPYQVVEDFAHDQHGRWQWLIVPLPAKVFVPGEIAESLGKERLLESAYRSADPKAADLLPSEVPGAASTVSFRSTVVRSNQFKIDLDERKLGTRPTALYRRLPMPRWVWVVEAVCRAERQARQPAVLAEAVIDATDHSRDMRVLAWRLPGKLFTWRPDEDQVGVADLEDEALIDSVARYVYSDPLPAQPA